MSKSLVPRYIQALVPRYAQYPRSLVPQCIQMYLGTYVEDYMYLTYHHLILDCKNVLAVFFLALAPS